MSETFIDVVLVVGTGGTMYWLSGGDPVVAGLWQAVVILVRGYQRHWREPPYRGLADQ